MMNIFPSTNKGIKENYREFLEGKSLDSSLYVKDFMHRSQNYQNQIANRDESLFHHSICLFLGIDMETVWISKFNTPNTKKSIWVYLNVFYSLGQRILAELQKEEEEFSNLSNEEKMIRNLSKESAKYNEVKMNERQKLIQSLTDKELIRELKRRKGMLKEEQETEEEDEDLMNFDPNNQEYSMLNALKGFMGNGTKQFTQIFETIKNVLGVDLTKLDLGNFDVNNFDFNNLGQYFNDFMNEDNINNMKNKAMDLVNNFQEDINAGDVNTGEIKSIFKQLLDMFNDLKSGNTDDFNNKANNISDSMIDKMIPPNMRKQFKNMKNDLLNNPEKLSEMMQDPQKLAQELFQGNKVAMNKFNNANRSNVARQKLKAKLEAKKKAEAEIHQEDNRNIDDLVKDIESSSSTTTTPNTNNTNQNNAKKKKSKK